MTTTLFAQPYDVSACGFYFETVEQYEERASKALNDFGQPVEEFEIQFIDGAQIDCELAEAIGLNQGSFPQFLDCVDGWEEWEKTLVIIAVGECGYIFDSDISPDHLGVEVYPVDTLRELAVQFVEDGLYGEIPETLEFYIDYDAIARDLSVEYAETVIDGGRLVYACR